MCVYNYVCVYTYIYIYAYTHLSLSLYIYIYMHTCIASTQYHDTGREGREGGLEICWRA